MSIALAAILAVAAALNALNEPDAVPCVLDTTTSTEK